MSFRNGVTTMKIYVRIEFWMLVVVVSMLWLRTALVPAPSGGDEVWWSESGYWLAHEGALRWDCMADDKGSGVQSFWPPIAAIIQGGLIWVFGLSSFSISAQSSIVATAILISVLALCMRLGMQKSYCLVTACAILGLMTVDRRIVQVRMENLTALFTLLVAYAMVSGKQAQKPTERVRWFLLMGFFLSVGGLCYYPQSPFLVLGACLMLSGGTAQTLRSRLSLVLLGAAPITLWAGIWIVRGWGAFESQVLNAGAESYVHEGAIMNLFRGAGQIGNSAQFAISWERIVVFTGLVIMTFRFGLRSSAGKLAILGFATSLPMFFIADQPQVNSSILFVVLLGYLASSSALLKTQSGINSQSGIELGDGSSISDSTAGRIKWRQKLVPSTLWTLALLGVAKCILYGITAVYQIDGRSYDSVAQELKRLVPAESMAAVSQRAWLGLRDSLGRSKLHFMTYSGSSVSNRSVVLKNQEAANLFDCVVIENDKAHILITLYPWLREVLQQERGWQFVGSIKPIWKPLPWAAVSCYELTVYRRLK